MRKTPAFILAAIVVAVSAQTHTGPVAAAEQLAGSWEGNVIENGQDCNMALNSVTGTIEKSNLTLRFRRDTQEFAATLKLKDGRFSEWQDLDVIAALDSEGRTGQGEAPIRLSLRFQGVIENNLLAGSFESARNSSDTELSTGTNCAASFKLAPTGSIEANAIRTGKPFALVDLEHRLIRAGLLTPSDNTALVPEPVEGLWIGKITETGNGCSLSLTGISAFLEGDRLKLILRRGDEETAADLGFIDNAFSEWKDLEVTASIDTDFGAKTGDTHHRLPLQFKGRYKDGRINGRYENSSLRSGAPGRATCAANFTLAPEESVEAEAIMTGKPAHLIALRRRVAAENPGFASRLDSALDRKLSATATETLDGEWIGKFIQNSEGCALSLSGITATVHQDKLTLKLLQGEHEAVANLELNDGKFSGWNDLNIFADINDDFGANVGVKRHRRSFQFVGQFDHAHMTGSLRSSITQIGGSARVTASCAGTYTMARAGSVEAEAISTGKPTDLIEIERLLPPKQVVRPKSQITVTRQTSTPHSGDETERRLRQLKKWVEEGLILPKEAAKKRAELLSKF